MSTGRQALRAPCFRSPSKERAFHIAEVDGLAGPLDPTIWRLVSPLLDRALEVEGRQALIDQVRAERPDVAAVLEELVAEHDDLRCEGFLESGPRCRVLPAPACAGTVVGAYSIEPPFAFGGTGSVWRARRNGGRVASLVAVRLLDLTVLDGGGAERLAREGSLLTRLVDPTIARLHARLSLSVEPHVVLEYVEADWRDQAADAEPGDARARLDRVLPAAAVVAHTHAHLILQSGLEPTGAPGVRRMDTPVGAQRAATS
jgi:serine/threonine-protein kinase